MWHHPKVQYLFLTRTRDLVYILHIPLNKRLSEHFFDGDILVRKKCYFKFYTGTNSKRALYEIT